MAPHHLAQLREDILRDDVVQSSQHRARLRLDHAEQPALAHEPNIFLRPQTRAACTRSLACCVRACVHACVHPCLRVHLRWCVQERACGVAPTPTDLPGRVCACAPTSLLVASTLRSAPPPISSTRAAEPSGLPPQARMRSCVRTGGRVRVCVCAHCWLAVTCAVWRQLARLGSASLSTKQQRVLWPHWSTRHSSAVRRSVIVNDCLERQRCAATSAPATIATSAPGLTD